jgi:hypothetical protein
MLSRFEELKANRNLTQDSSFEEIAQACIEVYYLPPYPSQKEASNDKSKVNRTLHGGVHVARTAMCAELFIDLYKKYAPELAINANHEKLTDRDIKLLKLAAVYHDSANISEIKGEPEEHANNFRRDMMLLGYEYSEIEPFAHAIENKDTLSPKNFFTKIIHDADCLEIIRCCSEKENYKKEYFDILKDLKEYPGFEIELDQIIENHFETIKMIEGDKGGSGSLHVKCEFSDNCYATLVSSMKNMLLTKAVIEAAESKKSLDLSKVKAEDFTSIDLFNRQNSPLIKRLLHDYSVSLQISESENDPAISLYQTNGILARVINSDRIDDEIDTLEKNAIAMRKASIENSEQMRRFISDQTGKAFAPAGFKWRPCTFIENGLPVSLIDGGIGVLFDPRPESGTMVSHFYKRNIFSVKAATGDLEYYRQKSGAKERGGLDNLREKINEQNKRREGAELDFNSHYYGNTTLDHSEILGTYQSNSVLGIFTSLDTQSIKDALILQAKLGAPLKPIYRYSPKNGLVRMSSEEIIQRLHMSEVEIQLSSLAKKIGTNGAIKFKPTSDGVDGVVYDSNNDPTEFKSYQISIPSDIPDHMMEKIKDYISNIRLCDLDNDTDESIPVKCTLNQSVDNLSIDIGYVYFFKGDILMHQEYMLGILTKISATLDADLAAEDGKMVQELVDALQNPNVTLKIQQKPDDPLTISSENPVKYIFNHPVNNEIRCECFVKNGLPMIELHLPDGRVITQETNKLPSIANKYFEQATERLQSHINNIDIKKELSEIGILNLDIRFVMKRKSCLALAFEVAPEFNKEAVQEKLLNMLGLPKVRNFNSDFLQKNYPNYQQDGNQVIFSIGDLQKIDSFVNRLSLRELKRLEHSSAQPMFNNSQTMWHHQHIPLSEAQAINKIDAKKQDDKQKSGTEVRVDENKGLHH